MFEGRGLGRKGRVCGCGTRPGWLGKVLAGREARRRLAAGGTEVANVDLDQPRLLAWACGVFSARYRECGTRGPVSRLFRARPRVGAQPGGGETVYFAQQIFNRCRLLLEIISAGGIV